MSDAKAVLLGTIVPILGGLVAVVMYSSPLKATYQSRKQKQLGELNPLPFAVTFASTACWNAYGFAAPDYNMFLPNIPGLAAAIYTSVTCYALASPQVQDLLLGIMCSSSVVILLLGVMTRFVMEAQQARLMWGIVCNIITVIYYAAPVSSAVKVVHTRNSASIYRPTCIANLVNAALWVAYGVAVSDPFIWVPNGIGGIMSVLLIALTILYPSSPTSSTAGALTAPLKGSLQCSGNGSTVGLLVDAGGLTHGLECPCAAAAPCSGRCIGTKPVSTQGPAGSDGNSIQRPAMDVSTGTGGVVSQALLRRHSGGSEHI